MGASVFHSVEHEPSEGAVTAQMTMYCIIKLVSLQLPKLTFRKHLLRAGHGATLRGLRRLFFPACVRCIL